MAGVTVCPICFQICNKFHMEQNHTMEEIYSFEAFICICSEKMMRHYCKLCGLYMKTTEFYDHLAQLHKARFWCMLCGETYSSSSNYRYHILNSCRARKIIEFFKIFTDVADVYERARVKKIVYETKKPPTVNLKRFNVQHISKQRFKLYNDYNMDTIDRRLVKKKRADVNLQKSLDSWSRQYEEPGDQT